MLILFAGQASNGETLLEGEGALLAPYTKTRPKRDCRTGGHEYSRLVKSCQLEEAETLIFGPFSTVNFKMWSVGQICDPTSFLTT